jgi:hypothetical protein
MGRGMTVGWKNKGREKECGLKVKKRQRNREMENLGVRELF